MGGNISAYFINRLDNCGVANDWLSKIFIEHSLIFINWMISRWEAHFICVGAQEHLVKEVNVYDLMFFCVSRWDCLYEWVCFISINLYVRNDADGSLLIEREKQLTLKVLKNLIEASQQYWYDHDHDPLLQQQSSTLLTLKTYLSVNWL